MENMDKGSTDSTEMGSLKMGADKSAEYTPNTPKFICPIFLPEPKSFVFRWKKASLGVRSPCY